MNTARQAAAETRRIHHQGSKTPRKEKAEEPRISLITRIRGKEEEAFGIRMTSMEKDEITDTTNYTNYTNGSS
jgi:hypothetical protein